MGQKENSRSSPPYAFLGSKVPSWSAFPLPFPQSLLMLVSRVFSYTEKKEQGKIMSSLSSQEQRSRLQPLILNLIEF